MCLLNTFLFLSQGVNLVCGAEHDYDLSWKLMMFNSTDTVVCPRNAQGIVTIQESNGYIYRKTRSTYTFMARRLP